jgi:riboflavin kinase
LALNEEQLLLFIAKNAGLHGTAETSTAKIASSFGASQQTASRKLRSLKSQGLISLNASPQGCSISLTQKGEALLKERLVSLQQIFRKTRNPKLSGTLKSGLGEGRYYVSRPSYLSSFKKLLGFRPFFGTLNLEVEEPDLKSFLSSVKPLTVPGFETDERSFGQIRAFPVKVEGKQKAALIIPERTAHPKNEVEVIAPANLRKKFKLKDGSRVTLSA